MGSRLIVNEILFFVEHSKYIYILVILYLYSVNQLFIIGDIKMKCEDKKKCEYLVTSDHHAVSYVRLYTCLAGVIPKQYPPASEGLRSEFCHGNFDQCGRYISTKQYEDQKIDI